MSDLICLFLFYCFGEFVIEFKRVRTINPEPELLLDSHVRWQVHTSNDIKVMNKLNFYFILQAFILL